MVGGNGLEPLAPYVKAGSHPQFQSDSSRDHLKVIGG